MKKGNHLNPRIVSSGHGVPAIGQAQIVERPSSPHASEIEPSVDEVSVLFVDCSIRIT